MATNMLLSRKLLILAMAGAAALFLLLFLRSGQHPTDAARDATSTAVEAAKQAAEAPTQAAATIKSIELPSGVKVEAASDSFVVNFYNAVNDAGFDINTALVLNGVNFLPGFAVLTPDSTKTIEQVVMLLKAYPNVAMRVQVHTDNVGDETVNKRLSGDQAAAVRQALVDLGIAPERIQAQGFGSEQPIADNATEEGRARDRRVDAVILKK